MDGQSSSGINANALNLGVGNAPPVDLTKDANGRIKTPTKEGYKIYNDYKLKVRKQGEKLLLPDYMQSPFKPVAKDGGEVEQLEYATDGSNFSIDPSTNISELRSRSRTSTSLTKLTKSTVKTTRGNQQIAEFNRYQNQGITSIANVASTPPTERDDAERQFFVMFLKLKVPFFADFDKKTLKLVMDRMLCSYLKKNQVITKFRDVADQIYIVINGRLGEYDGVSHHDCKGLEPNEYYEPYQTWGDEAMTEDFKWESTIMALKKSLVISLHKKDLIEVLQHVKVVQTSNKQTFLLKSQFLNELSYNRVLEFNDLLQEQRFYP